MSQAKGVIAETFRETHICSYTYLGIFQYLSQVKDVIAETFHETHICSYIVIGILFRCPRS